MLLKIGHRGAKGYVAENTLPSIQKALDLGVDGIEIDVHLCTSGELVVFHDFTLDRLTNGSGALSKFTLKELQQLKVSGTFTIPTLQDVLDLIDRRCIINIELKGDATATEACNQVEYYIATKNWKTEDFIISSFKQHELETVYSRNKDLRLGVLTEKRLRDAVHFARTVKAYALHPNFELLTNENVKRVQEQGFKVITWTVNDGKAIERMKCFGVDGIISDVPDKL